MAMKVTEHRRIDSPTNPLVKRLAALKESRARERSGEFLIEGSREATRALLAGVDALRLVYSPDLATGRPASEALLATAEASGLEIVELSSPSFDRLSLRQNPDGVALHAARPDRGLAVLGDLSDGLILVIDGVEKPGNVGAMLRTADAVGAAAVIVSGHGTDMENPNVIRASQGSVFALPLAVADTKAASEFLKSRGFTLVATTPSATMPHWSADLSGPVAVLVGAEDSGLSQAWLNAADTLVKIVMRASAADSLNVSVATAVVLYEAFRQRYVATAT